MTLDRMFWRCRHCGEMRGDPQISVRRVDVSVSWNQPPGTLFCHFSYCNDRPECGEAAAQYMGLLPTAGRPA